MSVICNASTTHLSLSLPRFESLLSSADYLWYLRTAASHFWAGTLVSQLQWSVYEPSPNSFEQSYDAADELVRWAHEQVRSRSGTSSSGGGTRSSSSGSDSSNSRRSRSRSRSNSCCSRNRATTQQTNSSDGHTNKSAAVVVVVLVVVVVVVVVAVVVVVVVVVGFTRIRAGSWRPHYRGCRCVRAPVGRRSRAL